jgi:hypothetical protein
MAGSKNRRARTAAGGGEAGTARQRFIESAGAAMVAGLLVVILGNIITSVIQNSLKDIDIKLNTIRDEREIVARSSGLVSSCVAASDDLIAITGENFDPARYPESGEQFTEIAKTYNASSKQWRNERRTLSLLMSDYHGGHPGVVAAWDDLQKSTTSYMECAEGWYLSHNADPVNIDAACKAEKDAVTERLDNLNARYDESRRPERREWASSGYPAAAPSPTPGSATPVP